MDAPKLAFGDRWYNRSMRAALLFFLAACTPLPGAAVPDGPAAKDFDALCNAEVRSGAVAVFPFSDKATTLNDWIRANVADIGVREIYFQQLPQTVSTEQGALLRSEADNYGVSSCPLADYVAFNNGLSYEAFSADQCAAACVKRNAGAMPDIESKCGTGCGADL